MKNIPKIWFQKICLILQRSLVETRNLALNHESKQIHDLADALEILPSMLAQWEEKNLPRIRDAIATYQGKYKDTSYNYLAILEMDDEAFRHVYSEMETDEGEKVEAWA